MMRWLLLAVLVIALTAAATVSVQLLPSPTSIDGPAFPNTPPKERMGPPARAVVEGDTTYEFGTMAQMSKGHKEWVIKNEGQGDLKLEQGVSTCSCTIANLAKGRTSVLKPGESTTVVLEWNTKEFNGKFSQSAEILTHNDPNRQKIEFAVSGTVRPALVTYPPGGLFLFPNISNETSHSAAVALISPDKSDLELTSLTSSRPEMLVATPLPLTEELKKELEVGDGSGYRIELEVRPGMPVGEIHESLVVETNHPLQPKIRMTVQGRAVGPIGVMPESLRLSMIAGAQPTSRELALWVRGQEETAFEVAKAPKKLKVDIAAVDEKGDEGDRGGKARRYRLTVTVPGGTPPGLIDGLILLKTDHPQAREVKIPVNITIRAEG